MNANHVSAIRSHLEGLQIACQTIMSKSLEGAGETRMAKSRHHAVELVQWHEAIRFRKESELLRIAAVEHEFALLALAQGQYRSAFKGLRLVLELSLQAVFLSTDELALREWLDNQGDTRWGAILEEESGIFSKRFARVFFPELERHLGHHRELARSVYRECSECVHGNMPKKVPLPSGLEFDEASVTLWQDKAEAAMRVIHFALCLRYLQDLSEEALGILDTALTQSVGHLEEIRRHLGGPATA